MTRDRCQHRLHIIGQHMVAPVEQRPGARRLQQRQSGTRAQSFCKERRAPAVGQQVLDIVEQRRSGPDQLERGLRIDQFACAHLRLERRQQFATVMAFEQGALGFRVGIAELDAHQETVEL